MTFTEAKRRYDNAPPRSRARLIAWLRMRDIRNKQLRYRPRKRKA